MVMIISPSQILSMLITFDWKLVRKSPLTVVIFPRWRGMWMLRIRDTAIRAELKRVRQTEMVSCLSPKKSQSEQMTACWEYSVGKGIDNSILLIKLIGNPVKALNALGLDDS